MERRVDWETGYKHSS